MPVRKGEAIWEGSFNRGNGRMKLGSGKLEGAYSEGSRFREEPGTNPDELIGAALAGCFSMALALELEHMGYKANVINTSSRVHIEKVNDAYAITGIDLHTEANIPGISENMFFDKAHFAKNNCPVSKALRVPITFTANLIS